MGDNRLLRLTPAGLYCVAGDFHIDPWEPVRRAIITHAHADHARRGMGSYLCTREGQGVLRARLGDEAAIHVQDYGASVTLGPVRVSLHPAGHLLGSCQVRLEHRGEVWVVSGDYKLDADQTCRAFEPIRCDTFITESTFGLPVYRWPAASRVFREIGAWWASNREAGRPTVIFAYALGKAQRLLQGLDASLGAIYCHGAIEKLNEEYRRAGVRLPDTEYAGRSGTDRDWSGSLIVAPPSAMASPWLRRFKGAATGFVSGWMLLRGTRRRRSVDRGFALSDHADWPGLLEAIEATGAGRVLVTHGHVAPMVRWLREQNYESHALETPYEGEQDEGEPSAETLADAEERPIEPTGDDPS